MGSGHSCNNLCVANSSLNSSRKYAIACADIMTADGDQGDSGIFARFFYPTNESDVASSSPVNKVSWSLRQEYVAGLASYKNISEKLLGIMNRFVGNHSINATWRGDLLHSQPEQRYPVVIFSHGLASARLFHSAFCSSLASYGYIVAAIEHRDRSACWTYKMERNEVSRDYDEKPILFRRVEDGGDSLMIRSQQLRIRTAECVKLFQVLEELNMGSINDPELGSKIVYGADFDWSQFKGRMNLRKTSLIGHSLGGATAITASAYSSDFAAIVVLDGWMIPIEKEIYSRCSQSTLFLNAAEFQWNENVRLMRQVGGGSSENTILTFKGAKHLSFTDFPLLLPHFISRNLNLTGETDPARCVEASVNLTVQFIEQTFEPMKKKALLSIIDKYKDFVTEECDCKPH